MESRTPTRMISYPASLVSRLHGTEAIGVGEGGLGRRLLPSQLSCLGSSVGRNPVPGCCFKICLRLLYVTAFPGPCLVEPWGILSMLGHTCTTCPCSVLLHVCTHEEVLYSLLHTFRIHTHTYESLDKVQHTITPGDWSRRRWYLGQTGGIHVERGEYMYNRWVTELWPWIDRKSTCWEGGV